MVAIPPRECTRSDLLTSSLTERCVLYYLAASDCFNYIDTEQCPSQRYGCTCRELGSLAFSLMPRSKRAALDGF